MTNVFGGTLNLIHLNCSLQEQLVQMSTTHSRFDQYCMHYLLYFSNLAPAEPGPGVRRECPIATMT